MNKMVSSKSLAETAVPSPADPAAKPLRGKISSKHLEGISDLTLTAPIKTGFIHSTESVTYETRLRLVMEALFKMRQTAREYSLIKPFVDTAERIEALLDFRLTILEPESGVPGEPSTLVLSATFDRPFEPYMRLIWDPLGPLLDVIFCNCDGYVMACGNPFEKYLEWVRSRQLDTNFFYAASGHSVVDVQYLAQIERLQREAEKGDCDLAAARATAPVPAAHAAKAMAAPANRIESDEMGIEALVSLYKLAPYYPPDQPEQGNILIRAAQGLLMGWDTARLPKAAQTRFADQLEWFGRKAKAEAPTTPKEPDFDPRQIQGGILSNFDRPGAPITHGCLLLMRVTDMAKARAFVGSLIDEIPVEGDEPQVGKIYLNIAFTRQGLVNLGLPAADLDKFPREVLEGMEERAGLLGDVRGTHPRRWNLPRRNWPEQPHNLSRPPIEMSEIDIVVQLRTSSDHPGHELVGDKKHPLHQRVTRLAAKASASGVELLSVESMRRAMADKDATPRSHFGFVDGLSQPVMVPGSLPFWNDTVSRGEIFLGYGNDRGDPPPATRHPLFDNGTFLVIRKLKQDVPGLAQFVKEQVERVPGLTEEVLLAKMMGRDRNGKPLVPGTSAASNIFDYSDDPHGDACPFQSHIRRANPRTMTHGRPTPRILRRGLSYGPPGDDPVDGNAGFAKDRGVFFMAYNASIAEQFEVIQRWVNGGNSSGVASCQSDPLMGVAQEGDQRTFRFNLNGELVRVSIPKPFVTLEWGASLFVPSIAGLRTIAALSGTAPSDEAERGEAIIRRLGALDRRQAMLAWKTCIEDFNAKDPAERAEAPAVWAAIRDYHGGALKVPYGDPEQADPRPLEQRNAVLVASEELVMQVYRDHARYSVCGYDERMRRSFGPIFLGYDPKSPPDPYDDYHVEGDPTNRAIMRISEEDAYQVAYRASQGFLRTQLDAAHALTGKRQVKIDLTGEYLTATLALVCRHYFGIPDHPSQFAPADPTPHFIVQGGWSWKAAAARAPRCPGDFMQPSR
jgi:Dyp-type peroxidase family